MIRGLKGLYMLVMFSLWAVGITLELLIILPIMAVGSLRGDLPSLMQASHRFLMGFWLRLMSMGRLLVVDPPVGQPVAGASVIVANHPGLFDVIVLIRDIPNMSILVKRSLARWLPIGPLLRVSGYVLSPQSANPGAALGVLNDATSHLRAGRRFLLFPEGTRSPHGELRTFHRGAFRIARQAQVPIQPVVIHNSPPFLPHSGRWYWPPRKASRLRLEFLPPLPPPPPRGEGAAAHNLEETYRTQLGLLSRIAEEQPLASVQ